MNLKQLWSYTFTPNYNEAEHRLACVQQLYSTQKASDFFRQFTYSENIVQNNTKI